MHNLFLDIETSHMPAEDELWEGADAFDGIRAGYGGLSVAVTLGREGIGLWDQHDLEHLCSIVEEAERVVTFNGSNFDLPVLGALRGHAVTPRAHLDLYEFVVDHLPRRECGYTLNCLCERTLGLSKIGHGEDVYELVKEGRWGKLYRYCLKDVLLLKRLYDHLATEGWFRSVGGRTVMVDRDILKGVKGDGKEEETSPPELGSES